MSDESHCWRRLAEHWFASVLSDEDEARRRYMALGEETERYVAGYGADHVAHLIAPYRARMLAAALSGAVVTMPLMPPNPALAERWRSWSDEYERLMERHPRLGLRRLLSAISGRYDGSSFPQGYEGPLLAWIESGDHEHPPEPRWGIFDAVSRADYDELLRLRRAAAGWWWHDGVCPLWRPDAETQESER